MSLRSTSKRYGSIAIGIHWLTAFIILVMLAMGFLMQDLEGDTRLLAYRLHALGGITVLALTVLRLLWRIPDRKPDLPDDMSGPTRFGARAAHGLLYLVLLGMAGSGVGILILSGLGEILSGASSLPVPREFDVAPRQPHEIFAYLLIALLVLHIGAALYHHFVRRDDVLRRMWPGGTP